MSCSISLFPKDRWFKIWWMGTGLGFFICGLEWGYGFPMIMSILILLAQSIALFFLRNNRLKLLWFVNLLLYFVMMRLTNDLVGGDGGINIYWILHIAFLVVVFIDQFLVWLIFSKINFYWLIYNTLAVTVVIGLWYLEHEIFPSGFIYDLVRLTLLGIVYGILSGLGLHFSLKEQ